jgi:hypothetical protein
VSVSNSQVVTGALRLLAILAETQDASAEQAEQGLDILNDMLAAWRAGEDGIDFGWYPQTDLNATAPIPDGDVRCVKYNLACSIAPEYGVEPTETTKEVAVAAYAHLARRYLKVVDSDMGDLPRSFPLSGWSPFV